MSEKPTYEELEQRVRELVKSESEHQQTEEALRASEERFRNLIEGSMQGILIHKDFKPLFLNKAYADIHGYTVDEILGMEIFPTLFAPNERTRIAEYNQARMQNKETPVKYEFQGQQKDGSSIWLNNVVRVIEWEGQPAIQSTIIDISARKLAEEKLRESEEYYRILLDAADHAGIGFILDQDIEGKEAICVFANETASNITGYSIEELSKLSWKELHHPKYQDMAVQRHRRRMTGEVMQGIFEISIITKDGREVPVEISSTQTEYQGDIALISFFKEITERKQAEEALRESEESLRTTINSIGDAVLATDTYGNIVRMNPVAEKLTGWGADDAKDKPVTEVFNIINAKTGEKVEHPVKRVLEEGEIIGLANHTMLIARDSTEYQIADSAAPIRDGEGNLTGVVLVFRDVTQEYKMREALRQSERRYHNLFDQANEGLFMMTLDGQLTEVNQAFADMHGYKVDELKSTDIKDLDVLKERALEDRADIIRRVQAGEIVRFEAAHYHKDGHIFPLSVTTSMIHIGGKTYFLAFHQDATERKQAEEERKKLQEQLTQAQKMESIGTLAGGIAHDFNNILTPIIVQSELALMDLDEDHPIQFNIKEVLKAGLRARDLVKQILTFSRQTDQQPVPLKITPIIKDAIKLLRASLPTTIEIRLNLTEDSDAVTADPTQVHQVLMNLCTNAGHAMRENGGVLGVGLGDIEFDSDATFKHADLKPGPYRKITVSDTGHGIPPEVMERIFEPFYTTKERSEGTGMGLAVVHGIIQGYGGAITVESEIEKGTTFNVFLPRTKTEIIEEAELDRELPTGNERILVVDDEKPMVDTLRKMLERLGYQVVEKTDSFETLEVFKAEPGRFDLVITDQTMPKLTGDKLAQRLLEIRSNIPIILCTGFSERINQEKAAEAGIKAFVMKPVVMGEIAVTIRKVLDGK